MNHKVFGIGLGRTGTTTLRKCFHIMGYNTTGSDIGLMRDYLNGDIEKVMQTAEGFDFAQDYPWAVAYKDLDQRFPGSKFILTLRSGEEVWYESLCSLAKLKGKKIHELVHGMVDVNSGKIEYMEFYRRHNEEVRKYFEGRNDFVEMCWEEGDGWEEICAFMGLDTIPEESFPHSNPSPNLAKRYYLKARRPLRALVKNLTGL